MAVSRLIMELKRLKEMRGSHTLHNLWKMERSTGVKFPT
ncbi:hypothetical protein L21SP2_2243 [Salinispira pacifica]|uniref:Uncharacterized protein n=1 Tax=Salinispira pacifica TaxID=1307761 RepID=V5WJ86_9SPIO|nr:hypothetical protein L21SP2_2243 [Salinispira pacifica]